MARSLPTSLQGELGQQTTRPGYLIYIGFDTPLRLCTFKDVVWDGHSWSLSPCDVSLAGPDRASIQLDNSSNVASSLILNEGINGKEIKIWVVYFDSTGAATDPYLFFEGTGDGADLTDPLFAVVMAVAGSKNNLYHPRKRICEATGFHYLPEPGQVVSWGNNRVVLE